MSTPVPYESVESLTVLAASGHILISAVLRGRLAYQAGLTEMENPYTGARMPGGQVGLLVAQRNAWYEGYREARDELVLVPIGLGAGNHALRISA